MSREMLITAIRDRKIVEFVYKNEIRYVEPHLLGRNQTGTLTLSAWQTSGKVGWRAFSVEKISALHLTGDVFAASRPGYNPNDSTMQEILCRL
ncbi:MAG TPA: WYL domain-containing protein [Rhizomicrobium sp.]|jgi:hypothetical protein